ncbi:MULTISPECIES: sodium/solute symporter [unclassified Mucilaginibacter]|uniref:sodium:solute symporter family transporter n=1 Tax=unclassified Mucilaginibacter TaxID=2617802 RepID=UPI002AC8A377|nr:MULTISPECIES: sodium/solute symporter [unclassified Mucilaginibacter]MEB0260868.1 sodium/solute symporter [Mucilaginibacter sp. 10I4]MEB0278458.1 sodium/solute symporter [Mucilaginibacter sp. 10B2]MEB0303084.1 sodium/solute symporter [Mucilaginibacter sp. 5C4]WPX24102.1 sodium/solute symporter [Mucilaginibacter sp. 5C4]
MKTLSNGDYVVFFIYFIIVSLYGYWIYRRKHNADATSKDYFLAEGSLTWWAIGASLIASNISAEQFIGTSGSAFKMGLAISTYEWMAAATLIVVAVFFIPIYLKNKIFTMPQFLNQRYNGTVAMVMAIFWLLLYIVVNLMSILYLGALAISGISGIDITVCITLLAIFAVFITLGGMKVIGYTDVIQVFVLILGGLVATYLALNLISEKSGTTGLWNGLTIMRTEAADHFHMIFKKDNANYMDMPGLSVLIGGMIIVNLNYWGCNQYITQRALGADLKTARAGLLFAAFLKLLMPVIVVLPGIAAYLLYQKGMFHQEMMSSKGIMDPNKAYPSLLNLLPTYLKGLSFAALTAAIVASLAGKANSIATIFTLDIYKKAINPEATDKSLVKLGKWSVVVAMALGVIMSLLIGEQLMGEGKQGFQYIQEYTGFVSPGIFAMFILGFFWKKATSNGALFATIGGFCFSVFFKFLPRFANLEWLNQFGFSKLNDKAVYEIPFIDRMGFVFLLCVLGMWIISKIDLAKGVKPNGLEIDASMFKPSRAFTAGALIVGGIIVALYSFFW